MLAGPIERQERSLKVEASIGARAETAALALAADPKGRANTTTTVMVARNREPGRLLPHLPFLLVARPCDSDRAAALTRSATPRAQPADVGIRWLVGLGLSGLEHAEDRDVVTLESSGEVYDLQALLP